MGETNRKQTVHSAFGVLQITRQSASVAILRVVNNNDGYPGKAEDWFCMRLLQGV